MPRSFEQWLTHQAQVHPQAIDMGLERLNRVLERLRWRPPAVPVITVAGTNGKGSVVGYCVSILAAAGHRAGAFTSPHLRDYRERIRLPDRRVTTQELVSAFERIEATRLAPPELSLTFFEYNALAAFLIFEAADLDVWVLEVGMGGRLDAVNIVDPTVAVVVSIGLDHEEFLGNTLDAIAAEKAGIFRRARTAVIGCREPPRALIEGAEARGAILKRLGVDYDYETRGQGPAGAADWHYRGSRWDLAGLPVPALSGAVQFANAAAAIAALEALAPFPPIPPAAIARGLRSVRVEGRFQVVSSGAGDPEWILDVAHNPDAAHVLAANLRELPAARRTLAVCAILADKDAAGIAVALRGCFDAWWVATTEGARGMTADTLAERIRAQADGPICLAADVAAACAAARSAAFAGDRIVVFGSFHTVGPALEWLESQGLLSPAA